jgi:hypothetical protein
MLGFEPAKTIRTNETNALAWQLAQTTSHLAILAVYAPAIFAHPVQSYRKFFLFRVAVMELKSCRM